MHLIKCQVLKKVGINRRASLTSCSFESRCSLDVAHAYLKSYITQQEVITFNAGEWNAFSDSGTALHENLITSLSTVAALSRNENKF